MKLAAGMESDLREAAAAVERQAASLAAPLAALIAEINRYRPRVVVTCARGSSAHAATFAKHLIELRLGMPVAAVAEDIAEQRPQWHEKVFFRVLVHGSLPTGGGKAVASRTPYC